MTENEHFDELMQPLLHSMTNYLTDDEKKKIAERVFEDEVRKSIEEFKRSAYNYSSFFSFNTLYRKIVEEYISKMNYVREDFIPEFNKMIESGKKVIIDSDGDIEYSPLVTAINDKLASIARETIDKDRNQIVSLVHDRLMKVCNEVLPLQIISKTVWDMNLPKESRERILSCLTTEYLNFKENDQQL